PESGMVAVPAAAPGRHVRPAGLDFVAGATLLRSGAYLGGAELAVAAACGSDRLAVAKPPNIQIFGGGDEIVAPGAANRDDQHFDCNSYSIAGLARTWGAAAGRGPILRDEIEQIVAAVDAALPTRDVIVLIGGASLGEHDHARKAATALGAKILFDRVSLRPG